MKIVTKILFLGILIFCITLPIFFALALTHDQQLAKDNCEAGGGSYNVDTGVCTCPKNYTCQGTGCAYSPGSGGCSQKVGPSSGGGGTGGGGGTEGGGGTGGGGAGTAGSESQGGISIENPLKWNSFSELVNAVIDFLFYLGLVVVPLTIVIAGIFLVTAGGDTEKVTQAKRIIWYSAIGLFIILFAKGIVSILNGILGVKK